MASSSKIAVRDVEREMAGADRERHFLSSGRLGKCRAVKMFLAGIVLGSEQGCSMHDRGYRRRIGAILKEAFHEAAISPPQEEQPNCVSAAGFLAFGLALQKANAKTKV